MHLHEGRTRGMNLKQGFHIEEPRVFVPWGISEGELKGLLGSRLRHVTNGVSHDLLHVAWWHES